MTDDPDNEPKKPEPRRLGGKTKRGASKRSPVKTGMNKTVKKGG
jgi:hypothetical protein